MVPHMRVVLEGKLVNLDPGSRLNTLAPKVVEFQYLYILSMELLDASALAGMKRFF